MTAAPRDERLLRAIQYAASALDTDQPLRLTLHASDQSKIIRCNRSSLYRFGVGCLVVFAAALAPFTVESGLGDLTADESRRATTDRTNGVMVGVVALLACDYAGELRMRVGGSRDVVSTRLLLRLIALTVLFANAFARTALLTFAPVVLIWTEFPPLRNVVDKTYESLEARLAAAAGGGDTPSHLRSRSLRPRGSLTRGSSTSSATAPPGAGWAAARRVLAVARFRALGRVRSRSRDPRAPPPPPPMPWRASSTASARSSLDSSVDRQMTPRLSHLNVDLDASVQAGSDPGRAADRSGGDARPSDGAPSTPSLGASADPRQRSAGSIGSRPASVPSPTTQWRAVDAASAAAGGSKSIV